MRLYSRYYYNIITDTSCAARNSNKNHNIRKKKYIHTTICTQTRIIRIITQTDTAGYISTKCYYHTNVSPSASTRFLKQ